MTHVPAKPASGAGFPEQAAIPSKARKTARLTV
jgi:hypothetical protein